MNVLIICGLYEKKLISKILPIKKVNGVDGVCVIRREAIDSDEIKSYVVPACLAWSLLLSEIGRVFSLFYLVAFKNIDFVVSICLYPHSLYAAVVSKLFRKKHIVLFAEDPHVYGDGFLFNFVASSAYAIGVRGRNSKMFIEKKFKRTEDVFVAHNFFDFSQVKYEVKDKVYDICFVGGFTPEKRMDIFLDVVDKLQGKKNDIKVAIVGSGKLEKAVRDLVVQKNLSENVFFLGKKDDVYEVISASKILLLTSQTEGMPMVLVEALSCGVPCVVPDVGDITDVAVQGINSLVVAPLNVDEFTRACLLLLEDNHLYSMLAENAKKIKEEKEEEYSMESISQQWRKILLKN